MNEMATDPIVVLLYFYGVFLIACGITAVLLIGMKAKTALVSGGFAGTMALLAGYLLSTGASYAAYTGVALSLSLFGVFSWRSAKTLFTLFVLISEKSPELNGKGIAFLIISLMAVVSLFVLVLQLLFGGPFFS